VAAPYTVRLIRGPCGGTTKTLTQAEFENGQTTCKGATYVYDGVTRPSGQLPHFTYRAGAPPPPPPVGGGSAGTASHAHKGWADIQKSVNRNLPTAISRAGAYNRAALRALASRRKVHH
jgi:hypothetical protein